MLSATRFASPRLPGRLLAAAAAAAHVLACLSVLPLSEWVGDSPILNEDYAIHYHDALEVAEFFRTAGRAWGYEPREFAGWPAGALHEVDNHPFATAVLLGGTALGAGRSFNLAVLLILVSLPFLVALGASAFRTASLESPSGPVAGAGWALLAAAILFHIDRTTSMLVRFGLLSFLLGSALGVATAGAASSFACRPGGGRWLAVTAGMALTAFAHPGGAVAAAPAIATTLALCLRARRWPALVGLTLAALAALAVNLIWLAPFVAFLPWLESVAMYLQTSARRLLVEIWLPTLSPRVLAAAAAAGGLAAAARRSPSPAVLALAAGIVGNGLLGFFGSRLGAQELQPARFLVSMWMFAAAGTPWLVTELGRRRKAVVARRSRLAWTAASVLVAAAAARTAAHDVAATGRVHLSTRLTVEEQ